MVLVISAPETDHRPLCARQKTVTLASVMEWAVSGLLGLMAPRNDQGPGQENLLTWAFAMERVTGIEPALSAWEAEVLPLNYTRMTSLPPVARSS
jgi:hypothetical protein